MEDPCRIEISFFYIDFRGPPKYDYNWSILKLAQFSNVRWYMSFFYSYMAFKGQICQTKFIFAPLILIRVTSIICPFHKKLYTIPNRTSSMYDQYPVTSTFVFGLSMKFKNIYSVWKWGQNLKNYRIFSFGPNLDQILGQICPFLSR